MSTLCLSGHTVHDPLNRNSRELTPEPPKNIPLALLCPLTCPRLNILHLNIRYSTHHTSSLSNGLCSTVRILLLSLSPTKNYTTTEADCTQASCSTFLSRLSPERDTRALTPPGTAPLSQSRKTWCG